MSENEGHTTRDHISKTDGPLEPSVFLGCDAVLLILDMAPFRHDELGVFRLQE